MNLIEQIQQTPKWGKFTEWYEKNKHLNIPPLPIFLSYEVMLQKGIFEKFIESQGQSYWLGITNTHYLTYPKVCCEEFNSFEELLIWYFNN